MTARQLQVADALQADGWFVLEADPSLWSDAEVERVRSALADREEWERAEQYVPHTDSGSHSTAEPT